MNLTADKVAPTSAPTATPSSLTSGSIGFQDHKVNVDLGPCAGYWVGGSCEFGESGESCVFGMHQWHDDVPQLDGFAAAKAAGTLPDYTIRAVKDRDSAMDIDKEA